MTKQPTHRSVNKSAAILAKFLAQSAEAKQLRSEIAAANDKVTARSIPSISKRITEALDVPTATAAPVKKPESRASLILKSLAAEGSPTNSRFPTPANVPTAIETTADLGQLVRRAR